MTHWSQIKNIYIYMKATLAHLYSHCFTKQHLIDYVPGDGRMEVSLSNLLQEHPREGAQLTDGLWAPSSLGSSLRSRRGHAFPRLFRSATNTARARLQGGLLLLALQWAIFSGGEEHLFWLRRLEMLCILKQFLCSTASLFPFLSARPTSSEKAMAPHSSILAWKIPWMEEPGRLQSMGSQRVGHDRATSLSLFTFMHWRRKWRPTPVFLPGESQGWGSLVGCRLWGGTESDTTEVT